MKSIIKYMIMGIVLLYCNAILAQQDPQFTQYMYNTVSFNPAYAGSNNTLNFNLLYRTQWVGLDGAPKTQIFSVNSPVGTNTALGLSIVNDEIGPAEEMNATVDLSYTLYFNDNIKFAFGIKAGFHSLQVDYRKLDAYNPIDAQFQENVSHEAPQIGIGGYLYTNNWYLGVSVPNMLNTEHYDKIAVSTAAERQHFFMVAGYVFQLNENIKFKPATLVKAVSGAPIGLDVSANFLFYEKLTLGTSYRLESSVSALAGFQISNNLMIGYAYDFDTTELSSYNSGSHEIFLKFEIFNKIRGKVSPRFF